MKTMLTNGRVLRLADVHNNKCITIDTNSVETKNRNDAISERTLLYIIIAIGIIQLIKK